MRSSFLLAHMALDLKGAATLLLNRLQKPFVVPNGILRVTSKDFFDNINHDVMIKILEKRINDILKIGNISNPMAVRHKVELLALSSLTYISTNLINTWRNTL